MSPRTQPLQVTPEGRAALAAALREAAAQVRAIADELHADARRMVERARDIERSE